VELCEYGRVIGRKHWKKKEKGRKISSKKKKPPGKTDIKNLEKIGRWHKKGGGRGGLGNRVLVTDRNAPLDVDKLWER